MRDLPRATRKFARMLLHSYLPPYLPRSVRRRDAVVWQRENMPHISRGSPSKSAQLYEQGCRLIFPLKKLVERMGGSCDRLAATQHHSYNKGFGA